MKKLHSLSEACVPFHIIITHSTNQNMAENHLFLNSEQPRSKAYEPAM